MLADLVLIILIFGYFEGKMNHQPNPKNTFIIHGYIISSICTLNQGCDIEIRLDPKNERQEKTENRKKKSQLNKLVWRVLRTASDSNAPSGHEELVHEASETLETKLSESPVKTGFSFPLHKENKVFILLFYTPSDGSQQESSLQIYP